MRVLLSSYGSRGDVEPLVALAVALKALGAEAILSLPGDEEFVELTHRAGVEMIPALMPVKRWIAEMGPVAKTDFPRVISTMMTGQLEAIGSAAKGCDAIVATGLVPSAAAAQAVAEKMGIRYEHLSLCPLYLPSTHHKPFPFPGHPLPEGVTDNAALWAHNIKVIHSIFGGPVNAGRESVGLKPVSNVRDYVFTPHPWLASDPVLWPWEKTEICDPVVTAAWILPDTRPLPSDLIAFLDAGERPVYVGFGSMTVPTAKAAGQAALDAVRALGLRAVVGKGWADLGLIDDRGDCFAVGDLNQQKLFPRMAAVVHHGGAGTTTTATRAGAPQVIVPQIVDQPYWAGRVAGLGIGAAHDGPSPTFESMTAALKVALAEETRLRAVAAAERSPGDGAMKAARLLLSGK
ncbi:MAG TPA: glycosyltransferase [Hyphomonadaceae bacterium]|nr:glycosyltransferase [Hyphomonadaceae bacterium]